ncbi:kinase-like domain-containing protein [Mycena sanguinolenta]|nr:kinase-like domain-containing protein [Mycena sanguinolenta]
MDDQDVPDEEMLQQTQEEDSGTQPTSQPEPSQTHKEFWGYLSPCLSQTLERVSLHRSQQVITIGRHEEFNMVVFPGFKISNRHAIIRWNGLENSSAIVTIEDISTNGTFINGEKIGKGNQRLLKEGNEIAFGSTARFTENNGLYDYRYMFRDLVSNVKKRPVEELYDIHNELGKGSFATVYKALHKASGDWVAVKVINETKRQNGPSGTATTSDARPRPNREIDVMNSLRHPNICELREVFYNANGGMDLVLELVEGGDLLDFILSRNGLTEDLAKHITYQLCQALAYIHEKGIAHRDLKPENVLLTTDDPPIVKVADFGLAKIVDEQTRLKTMCGTPSYLAPEVVTQQNNSGYDSLVDSWSVGVILFSMCTNTTPFIEPSVEDLKTRIAERQIEWTQVQTVGLSPEAVDFLRCLLEYNPRDRMKLSDALEHPWLQGYVFAHPIKYPEVTRTGSSKSSLSEDVSMRTADRLSFTGEAEAVSQGFEHMKLNGSTSSAFTPGFAPTEGTEKGELRRRADILQEAVETDQPLIEPSQEMINYVQSQESDLYRPESQPNATASGSGLPTPTNGTPNANGKGPNKRVHSELTPLPEEMEDDTGSRLSEASSPLSSVGDLPDVAESEPLRKKGRSAEDTETPSKTATRAKRGSTAKATATPTARKGKAKPDSNADAAQTPVATRRSTRAKIARR